MFNTYKVDTLADLINFTDALITGQPSVTSSRNFPPHNFYSYNNGKELVYVLAVAGYQHDDLDLKLYDDTELCLTGKPSMPLLGLDPTSDTKIGSNTDQHSKNGIKNASFHWQVSLPKGYEITKAKLKDGLMWIRLREITKAKKSVKIEF